MDVHDVKNTYSPSYVLETICHLVPMSESGGWKRYMYEDDSRPSLCASDEQKRIKDHKGRVISPFGEDSTDVIGFVQHHFACTFLEAMEMISGDKATSKREHEHKPQLRKQARLPSYTVRDLNAWRDNLQANRLDYLVERKISPEYAYKIKLGYRLKQERDVVSLDDGSRIEVQSGWRFVFPYFYGVPTFDLWRITQRLDTDRAIEALNNMSTGVKENLFRTFGEEKRVLDNVWRSKYLHLGPYRYPFQYWQVRSYQNGQWKMDPHELVFNTEGQIDSINLHEYTGRPSVSSKKVFSCNADVVIIVRDNDQAGIDHSERIEKSMENVGQKTLILTPFDEFNDVNDMARAGALKDWLRTNNLPVKGKTS